MIRVMSARVFRVGLPLRLALAAAAAVWGLALFVLARAPEAPVGAVLTAIGFLAYFVLATAHYALLRVVVAPGGLVFASPLRRLRVPWDEVLRVQVRRSPIGTLYAVVTRRGLVQFSSLLSEHRQLLGMLLDGARLVPNPGG